MKLYRTTNSIIVEQQGLCYALNEKHWDELINCDNLAQVLQDAMEATPSCGDMAWLNKQALLAPVGSQEVWAAGVTYLRSKTARMDESRESGAATFYDKVYEAARPELFFKANAPKVIGPGGNVRIRRDSSWNVPEPELTLVINAQGKIAGYTIGNDMSSRSIEGENPLYLPQAKTYDGSASIGPCILVTSALLPGNTGISMSIVRNGQTVFEGSTTIDRMKRSVEELAGYLFRESSFAQGVYLMTGTCIVPENDFTLQAQDKITITIDGIGTLENTVAGR
jgi:2-dehydro-3-deoxy-D-arabinonate dehydratase